MTNWYKYTPLVCALVLIGCAVGPDYERPKLDLPAHYNDDHALKPTTDFGVDVKVATTDIAIQPDWWVLYNDPELNKLEAAALDNNADLQMAIARIAQAQGLALQAGAAQYPSLGLQGSGTRASQGPAASSTGTYYMNNSFQGGVTLAYELDIWGQVRRSVESADAQVKASVFDRDSVRLTLTGTVAKTYIALRALDAQIKVTQDSVRTRQETLRIAKAKLDGGLVSPIDVNQAMATLASLQATNAELVRQRAVTQNQLAVLTGQLDLKLPAGDLNNLPIPPVPPAGLPSTLLEARPDVRKAEEQLVSSNALIGVAKANFFPSLNITGQYGAQTTSGFANFLTANGAIWAAALGLTQPLFTGGQLTGQYNTAQGKAQESLANYVKTVRTAFSEVGDALVTVRQTLEAEDFLTVQVGASSKAQQLAILRYQSGYVDYLNVLDAQRAANEASLAYVQNRSSRLQASVDLFKALGGGWKEEKLR